MTARYRTPAEVIEPKAGRTRDAAHRGCMSGIRCPRATTAADGRPGALAKRLNGRRTLASTVAVAGGLAQHSHRHGSRPASRIELAFGSLIDLTQDLARSETDRNLQSWEDNCGTAKVPLPWAPAWSSDAECRSGSGYVG